MKKLLPILIALLLPSVVFGYDTLYEFYLQTEGRFPSKAERSVEYNQIFPDIYTGSYEQNIAWLDYLNQGEGLLFGGSVQTPNAGAFIEDSLQAPISDSATSFTLVSGKDGHGTALASSTYGFVIDEGTASQEIVVADCTSTACTNATRGLSFNTGTSTVSGAAKAHRRGASVKITDAPFLLFAKNVFLGTQNIEYLMKYNGTKCNGASVAGAICDKSYIDNVALSGAATSSATQGGIVRLSTQVQMASSTDLGGNDPLVLQAKFATSSPQVDGLYVPISQNNGFLHQGWLNLNESWTFASSSVHTFGATNLYASSTIKFKDTAYSVPQTIASTTQPQVLSPDGTQLQWVGNSTTTRSTIPYPVSGYTTAGAVQPANDSTLHCGKIRTSFDMNVGKISIYGTWTTGTFDLGVYSESGKEKIFEVTPSATSTDVQVVTTTVSPSKYLRAGEYYACVIMNTGGNLNYVAYKAGTQVFRELNKGVGSSRPLFSGVITGQTAGTLPSSFDPNAFTQQSGEDFFTPVIRLDY